MTLSVLHYRPLSTGLDPAQPYFEDTQPEVRLDATDAEFVDIVHTDGRDIIYIGIGYMEVNEIPDELTA